MKITNFTISEARRTNGGAPGEKRQARVNRMTAFWNDPTNKRIVIVGKLLANVNGKKSLAQWLADGEEIEMSTLNMGTRVLPLEAGFKISLANITSVWGCPACKSAHGSGTYPSREIDVTRLESTKWYYNPVTKALFTISATCWGDYVKALGADTPARFVTAGTLPESKKVETPAKVAPKVNKAIDAPPVIKTDSAAPPLAA